MTHQRKRGDIIKVYKTSLVTDRRGNETITWVPTDPHVVHASITPVRGSRAEVPGQQEINVYHCTVPPDLTLVDLWSRVEWKGNTWDVVAPPVAHKGTRATRHWSFDIRLRPGEFGDELFEGEGA